MSRGDWEYCDWYQDGDLYVCLLTGMPENSVRIGIGETPTEAYDSMEGTPIQSVGRDCGLGDTLEWAVGAGLLTTAELDSVDTPARSE